MLLTLSHIYEKFAHILNGGEGKMGSHLLFAVLLLAFSFIGCAQASVTPTTPTPTPTPTPIPEFPAYSLLIAASSMIVLAFVISRRGGRNKQRA